jgi:hypothetical protein
LEKDAATKSNDIMSLKPDIRESEIGCRNVLELIEYFRKKIFQSCSLPNAGGDCRDPHAFVSGSPVQFSRSSYAGDYFSCGKWAYTDASCEIFLLTFCIGNPEPHQPYFYDTPRIHP